MLGMIFSSIIEAIVEGALVILVIYGFCHEKKVVAYEKKLWRKFKAWLSAKLRSSRHFMKWLYEPTVSERIEADYKPRTVRTWEYE